MQVRSRHSCTIKTIRLFCKKGIISHNLKKIQVADGYSPKKVLQINLGKNVNDERSVT